MREITLHLQDDQASVVSEAITDSKFSFDSWIEYKLDAAIKAQRTANLAKSLRGFAQACKLSLAANADKSVEDFVIRMSITDRVTEFGGIGMFVKLANSCKGEYIPESKIRRQVVAVPAAKA